MIRIKHERIDLRPSASERGYNHAWHVWSKDYLIRHPICIKCGAPSTICDHIVCVDMMISVFGTALTYKDSDYQPLCLSCNAKKGANEDRLFKGRINNDKN